MYLSSICTLSKEQSARMQAIWEGVKARFPSTKKYEDVDRDSIFEYCNSQSGYAHCMYRGKLKPDIQLDELELAMVCDNGYSHFGGYSILDDDGTFTVKIYTD